MSYSVVINRKDESIKLYSTGTRFLFDNDVGDIVVKLASFSTVDDYYIISGQHCNYAFVQNDTEYASSDIKYSKYRESDFRKQTRTVRKINWRVPFVRTDSFDVWVLLRGWHALRVTQKLTIKIPKEHIVIFDYSDVSPQLVADIGQTQEILN